MTREVTIISRSVFTKVVFLLSVALFVWLAAAEESSGEIVSPPVDNHQIHEELETDKQPAPNMPDLASIYFHQGLRHYDLGEWREAIIAFRESIGIKPDSEVTYFSMGIAYSRLEIWEEALASFTRAVEIDPHYAEAYLGIGIAFSMLGWDNVAIQALEKATRIKPEYAHAHYALALSYLKVGDKKSALKQHGILETLDQNLADQLIRLINH